MNARYNATFSGRLASRASFIKTLSIKREKEIAFDAI
jgi:hypothetical protein